MKYFARVRDDLRLETEKLTRMWAQHDPTWLCDYLVAGVEYPRLNVQSILSRHFLIRALFEAAPQAVMLEEYRFAAVLSWLKNKSELMNDSESRAAALHALRRDSDNSEGLEIPPFILRAFRELPTKAAEYHFENYLEEFLTAEPAQFEQTAAKLLDTFVTEWNRQLSMLSLKQPAQIQDDQPVSSRPERPRNSRPSLLEPACGSANDYRFLDRYGIAPFLNYTGFDLCENNIENARQLFPDAEFHHANVFDIPAPDKRYDFSLVHDLFEHLSPDGLERAAEELCRVTRRGMCLGFFQMAEIPQHVVRPIDEYHWNLLSVPQTKRLFASKGFDAQVIHIDSFLYEQTSAPGTHNPDAYTFILWAS